MNEDAQDLGRFAGLHMDIKVMAKSLTGFDEIAIRKAFASPFEDLSGMFGTRALLFTQLRRDGATDADAFKVVMDATVGEIMEVIGVGQDGESQGNGPGPTPTMM